MTPTQQQTVNHLIADGFHIVLQAKDIVRLTKGADKRVVQADGTQKRGWHVEPTNVTVVLGCV